MHRELTLQLCVGDSEAQDLPREVIVLSSSPRPDLTKAFENPRLLRGNAFDSVNKHFTSQWRQANPDQPFYAILIKPVTSAMIVTSALAVAILFSITVGVIAGLLTGDVKTGLAVCAGAIGVFALIQASMAGLDNMNSKTEKP